MKNQPRAFRGLVSFGRLMLLVLAVFLMTGGYMFQRHMNLKLTWRLARQEAARRVIVEELDRLEAELQQLSGFARLDSIWANSGQPKATGWGRATGVGVSSDMTGTGETLSGRVRQRSPVDVADGRQ